MFWTQKDYDKNRSCVTLYTQWIYSRTVSSERTMKTFVNKGIEQYFQNILYMIYSQAYEMLVLTYKKFVFRPKCEHYSTKDILSYK